MSQWRPTINWRNGDRRRAKRQAERRALTRMVLRTIAGRPGERLTPDEVAESLGISWGDALSSMSMLKDRGYAENYGNMVFASGTRFVELEASWRYRVTAAGIAKTRE